MDTFLARSRWRSFSLSRERLRFLWRSAPRWVLSSVVDGGLPNAWANCFSTLVAQSSSVSAAHLPLRLCDGSGAPSAVASFAWMGGMVSTGLFEARKSHLWVSSVGGLGSCPNIHKWLLIIKHEIRDLPFVVVIIILTPHFSFLILLMAFSHHYPTHHQFRHPQDRRFAPDPCFQKLIMRLFAIISLKWDRKWTLIWLWRNRFICACVSVTSSTCVKRDGFDDVIFIFTFHFPQIPTPPFWKSLHIHENQILLTHGFVNAKRNIQFMTIIEESIDLSPLRAFQILNHSKVSLQCTLILGWILGVRSITAAVPDVLLDV